jgi:hypothetical protein
VWIGYVSEVVVLYVVDTLAYCSVDMRICMRLRYPVRDYVSMHCMYEAYVSCILYVILYVIM